MENTTTQLLFLVLGSASQTPRRWYFSRLFGGSPMMGANGEYSAILEPEIQKGSIQSTKVVVVFPTKKNIYSPQLTTIAPENGWSWNINMTFPFLGGGPGLFSRAHC